MALYPFSFAIYSISTRPRSQSKTRKRETVVLDADSGRVVAKIPAPSVDPSIGLDEPGRNTPFMGVHYVGIAPQLGRGFISNGRAGSATVIDLKTLQRLGEVKLTGKDPN